MNPQIDTFIGILTSKLIHLDRRLKIHIKPIEPFEFNKPFHFGVELIIEIEVFVIKAKTVKWLIQLMEDFNFNYDLCISRYLLDPKRNIIDDIPKDFQNRSNTEFYLTINPSKTKLKGRFISKWDSNGYGWHVSNDNYYFKVYQQEKPLLGNEPLTIYPAQNN